MKSISRRRFLQMSAAAGLGAGFAGQFARFPLSALSAARADTTLNLWHGWAGADNTDALNQVLTQLDFRHFEGQRDGAEAGSSRITKCIE